MEIERQKYEAAKLAGILKDAAFWGLGLGQRHP